MSHERLIDHFTSSTTIINMANIIPVRAFLKNDAQLRASFVEMAEAVKAFIAKNPDGQERCVRAVQELTAAVKAVMDKTTVCLKGDPNETHREIAEAVALHLVHYAKEGNDLSL